MTSGAAALVTAGREGSGVSTTLTAARPVHHATSANQERVMKVVATKWGNSASVPIPAAVMAAVRRWARRHEALLRVCPETLLGPA